MQLGRLTNLFIFLGFICSFITCPPVSEKPPSESEGPVKEESDADESLGLEYERYMREVVKLLESDEQFRKKLEEVNSSQIRSGEIATHLDFVSRNIRTKLDELKRNEIERLRNLIKVKEEMTNSSHGRLTFASGELDNLLGHLDIKNTHTFEIADLTKLIKKTTLDLEEIDGRRREEFKKYEMEKEHVRRQELKKMSSLDREEAEKRHGEAEKKHKDHPKINHPGNEEQLKEVWEEADGLDPEDFDPKTFFHIHDTNGDGLLDITELESLYQKELDKMYDVNATEDDMMERFEEMNRMREHVMKEVDMDKDGMVSLDEFLRSTQTEEFKKNESWQTLDNETIFTNEEMERFEKEYAERLAHEEKAHTSTMPSLEAPISNQDDHQQQQQQFHQQPVQREGTASSES